MLSPFILPFAEIGPADLPSVGGKGANLGVLARAGFPVPPGFAVTTVAFRRFLEGAPGLDQAYAALDAVSGDDVPAARQAAERTRDLLAAAPMPDEIAAAVVQAWRDAGPDAAWAVRSSATAEDLPGASFAGQQDTYLNIRGEAALLDAVKRCWISLFTDRAVLYRAKNGFGHRAVALSVVVQRMVFPEAAGILFTADPVSGHRGTISIDAGFGLGEALVSGLVSADLYKVDKATGALLDVVVGDKAIAIRPLPEGGTETERLSEAQRGARVLDDATITALARLGAAIEAHYGGVPQDVEWCLENGRLYVVQARPVTSLFPIPVALDLSPRVFVHFGHLQMMTEPMSPLGRDVWRLMVPLGRTRPGWPESTVLLEAGSRLFVDPTPLLRVRALRDRVLPVLAHIYAPAAAVLERFAARPASRAAERARPPASWVRALVRGVGPILGRAVANLLWRPVTGRAREADLRCEALVEQANATILAAPAGAERIRALMRVLSGMITGVGPQLLPYVGSGILARRLLERLAEGRADPDLLAAVERGLDGNVTTEMDQRVADLADRVRPYPELAAHLRDRPAAEALSSLDGVPGGPAFGAAFDAFLGRYGMRAAGEIDLARPRWRDDPSLVLSAVLGNLAASAEPGAHRARAARQAEEATAAIAKLERAVSGGPLGWLRRRALRRLASVARAGLALREHPKFVLVRVLDTARAAVLEEGARLVASGRLATATDVFQLHLPELLEALDGDGRDLRGLVAERLQALEHDRKRAPPLAMTSDGEILTPPRPADLPPGALSGVAASAGVIEGTARVVRDPAREVLHAGEILVAPFTDPGWTPLFVHAAGLVTEVGGLMTHGSVVAREYGIPAVVSVSEATTRIQTGDRIRVDGTRGIVEVLA